MEIELKLLADARDLERLARHEAVRTLVQGHPRGSRLVSTYYDTPDFALLAAGYALRLRRDRARWVQTLKGRGLVAAGLHQREEYEWPVAGETLEPSLLRETPARKFFSDPERIAALRPIFVTDFVRSTRRLVFPDGTEAQLGIDRGAIHSGRESVPISEVEIELISGSAARAFELALAVSDDIPLRLGHASKAERGYRLAGFGVAGPVKAQPVALDEGMNAVEALRAIAWSALAHMQSNEEGVFAGRDPEFLHQFRVGLRRLRSALALARAAFLGTDSMAVLGELRWLQQTLGPARDWDVFATETLPPIVGAFPEERGLKGVRVRAATLRREHGRIAREALAGVRYRKLVLDVGLLLAGDALSPRGAETAWLDAPVTPHAAALLDQRWRKLAKRAKRLADGSAAELHAVRIAAKKLRYAAEFFSSLFARKAAARYARRLSRLQDALGAINDAAVTARLLDELAASGKSVPDPAAIGIVRGWAGGAAEVRRDESVGRYRKLKREKIFWR